MVTTRKVGHLAELELEELEHLIELEEEELRYLVELELVGHLVKQD